jgi:hypothetical protein
VFEDPEIWSVSGSYTSSSTGAWNGNADFHGSVIEGKLQRQFGQVGTQIDCGDRSSRPALGPKEEGRLYFDTSIKRLVIWSDGRWLDAFGVEY